MLGLVTCEGFQSCTVCICLAAVSRREDESQNHVQIN